MASIDFEKVSRRFGEVVALHELDLSIDSGEFVSLLGPSGSGKTTTLNLLAGLLKPSSGSIMIDGKPVTHLSPDKRDLAMVFQNFALYPHLTVYENLAFPLKAKVRRIPRERIATKIGEVSEMLGIGALLHRYPKELSGGQQQRVALGRSLVRDPPVFLLDEPLSNLDARLRIKMRLELKALHERIGNTVVYVTHDQEEAMTLSTRVAVFDHGHLQQVGTPAAVYEAPTNMFVANFVGEREMNFLQGDLRASGSQLIFGTPDGTIDLGPPNSFVEPSDGAPVLVGVRPESVEVLPAEAAASFRGKVAQTERTGAEQVLHVRLESGVGIACKVEARSGQVRGDRVSLRFQRENVYLFDSGSGACLNDYRAHEHANLARQGAHGA